jgi:hypothetical protein
MTPALPGSVCAFVWTPGRCFSRTTSAKKVACSFTITRVQRNLILQEENLMRLALIIVTFMVLSSRVYAACYTNAWGHVVCNNGQAAAGYNANTGTAWKSERNQYGVATTKTSNGGEAKTRNGKGVYKSPSGKKCYKSANSHGCT